MEKTQINNKIKIVLVLIAIITAIYLLYSLTNSIEIVIGALSLSIGILAIIWTLIANFSLSKKSSMRLFTSSFLASLIALVSLSFINLVSYLTTTETKTLLYVQYSLTSVVYLFFLLAAYYILSIGKQFGFQSKALEIKKVIISKKKKI